MVKHGQRLTRAEPIGFKISPVDFALMAKAMGAEGYVIHQRGDFDKIDFKAMLTRKGPTLLDVHIDPEEVPPMGMRVKTLTMR
jgi:acetolactate synthase-1/2/3 large subunit